MVSAGSAAPIALWKRTGSKLCRAMANVLLFCFEPAAGCQNRRRAE
jgi:hypothetical protein